MDVSQPRIQIQVHTKYVEEQSNPELARYIFAYIITIKNHSSETVQLLSRRWLITDANGKQISVEGDGVVGQQPFIDAGDEYTYSSGTALDNTLWVAGDLVARGPKSLETLRFIKSLGDSAKVVLGNHDLHLIAVSLGIRNNKAKDKTAPIFESEDGSELLHWLRQQPLLAEHSEFIVCHAGISPQWDLSTARQCAEEVESLLRSENYRWLIENMYCNQPDLWQDNLSGLDRYRYIINAFTRMRFCFADGRLDMDCKLPPRNPFYLVIGRL